MNPSSETFRGEAPYFAQSTLDILFEVNLDFVVQLLFNLLEFELDSVIYEIHVVIAVRFGDRMSSICSYKLKSHVD